MKLKLYENLGSLRIVTRLRLAGYDVATVREQNLTSTPDPELIDICRSEGRCLVTLDRGFGNRLRYNPAEYRGIVVIKLPNKPKLEDFREAVEVLIAGLERSPVEGKLWILQGGKIQEYQPIDLEEKN